MSAKFAFVSVLVTINAFFIGYAAGFNSRHILVVDKSLPPYVKPVQAADKSVAKPAITPSSSKAQTVKTASQASPKGKTVPVTKKSAKHKTDGAKKHPHTE